MIRNKVRKNFKPITKEVETSLKGELVGVHYNAHEKCWSVVSFKSRKTVAKLAGHAPTLVLDDISFKVDLSKKRKAFEKGTKDRHTFIVGVFVGLDEKKLISKGKLFYNPTDNIQPFKNVNGESVVGKKVYFSKGGKVYQV